MMFVLVLVALVAFGGTVWVVLNRPVARNVGNSDRASRRLLAVCTVALVAGVAFGLHSLF